MRLFGYPQSFAMNRMPGALALIFHRGRAAHRRRGLRPRLRLGFPWMRRVLFLLSLALVVVLVAAPVALGHDGGQGTYGEAMIAPPPKPMIARPVAMPGRSGNHLISVETGEM